ncbi:PREDICTED: uncharacterized protein LOC106303080 [Brassica oleracea var. oleracea]|uniref:SWIM-type domain-containing protein n=1 Tax=Brassica oleracea var. oleracea TaxID=109376 RepID=A0A0D3DAG9_BRAOL|nr:PREDICTED: uncharacterized protein LOC106303080 [Brassica oleracea var. oleracea]
MASVDDVDGGETFDEEAEERDECEIEHLLNEFVDEPSIRHDQIPESDDEEEKGCKKKPPEVTHIKRGDGSLYKKHTFVNGVGFKDCVLNYALKTGHNIQQYMYDKDKIGFKCVGSNEGGSCEWKIYASVLSSDNVWKVRVFVENHSCVPNGECSMLKVPQIARLFVDKIREEPDYYMPMKIEQLVLEKWGITVSRAQCQAARTKALKWIEFEYDHQFARLRDYAAEILESNKDSTVVIETLKNTYGKDEFNRFYICFDNIRRTWKETCRPLLGVDGCFVKHKIKGQVLVALGRDADNAIYPVAWGVVQVENTDNWLWFVRMIREDLGLDDGDGFVIVSDRQKGLIAAVKEELPKVEHRKCVRHIYENLKKKHGSKSDMKSYLWSLAWSYNEAEYKERLDRILNYDVGVYDDVMKTNPKSWCRAYHRLGPYCEDVENNSTESFNNTIGKARELPFVPMFETIRRLAMARIAKRSAISHAHKGICTPYATEFLKVEKKKATECTITRSTNGMYEAKLGGCTHRVSSDRWTCTCMKFEICGIPCEHAYGVILHKKLKAEDFVCKWFRTSMWRRNYTDCLIPVRGARFWPQTSAPDVHIPPDPDQPGRKKLPKAEKKRKKPANESPTKKQPKHKKRIMHCEVDK